MGRWVATGYSGGADWSSGAWRRQVSVELLVRGFGGFTEGSGRSSLHPHLWLVQFWPPTTFLPNFFLTLRNFWFSIVSYLQLDFRSVFAAYKETLQNHGGANTVLLSNPQSKLCTYISVPWRYVHPHSSYFTILPAHFVLASFCLMRQFTATLCHLYDTSRD
jgi:hypothetical protein